MRGNEFGYSIKWRPLAEEDLNNIIRFITEDNKEIARSFGKALYTKTQMLMHHPYMGRENKIAGIRELVVHKNYIVCYRLYENTIEILRVKHAAQDQP